MLANVRGWQEGKAHPPSPILCFLCCMADFEETKTATTCRCSSLTLQCVAGRYSRSCCSCATGTEWSQCLAHGYCRTLRAYVVSGSPSVTVIRLFKPITANKHTSRIPCQPAIWNLQATLCVPTSSTSALYWHGENPLHPKWPCAYTTVSSSIYGRNLSLFILVRHLLTRCARNLQPRQASETPAHQAKTHSKNCFRQICDRPGENQGICIEFMAIYHRPTAELEKGHRVHECLDVAG